MAGVVETQRLISVSLGKIAHSRAQRGGINLHKNLLVASVLNKARTAFMMENYSHQLALQQQKQQQQQIVLTAPQPTPVCNNSTAPSASQHEGNSVSPQSPHVVKTCQATPDFESRSTAAETTQVMCEVEESPIVQHTTGPVTTDKENISPSMEHSLIPSATTELTCEGKQQSVSGEQHIEAANQLSQEAQLAGSQSSCEKVNVYSSFRQSSTVGILKRRRDNPEALTSIDSECSISKKARVSSDCSFSPSQQAQSPSDLSSYSSSCEYDSDCESDLQSKDSPQITNLVTILNSGFSGLCVSSSSTSYESSHEQDTSSMSHQWSNTNQSHHSHSHCSSQVERIGSLSSAIVLSA